ncbi:MAG: NUDIX domain-containing protein [Spirochaetota bacterium]
MKTTEVSSYAKNLAELPSVHDIDWEAWEPTVDAVLCYIVNPQTDEVLLIKRLSSYGHGLVSGPGGKREPQETLRQCVVRECLEEVAIEPHNFRLGADLYFHFTNGVRMRGYAYMCAEWSGNPQPSEEAIPFWCKRDRLPLLEMWEDDALWLPYVLEGFCNGENRQICGHFIFDEYHMVSYDIKWL